MKFVPERLEVAAGDGVTWVNKDLVPHTVTAPGASWKFIVRRRGEMPYRCRFHPTMKAVVVAR